MEDAINVTSFCQTTGNGSLLAVYAERTRMRKLPFDHDDHVNEEQIQYLNHPFEANVAFRFAFAQCNSTKTKSNFDIARLSLEFALISIHTVRKRNKFLLFGDIQYE